MIKFVCTVPRRPDFTKEAFLKRWKEEHGALVHHHANELGIRRYVQSHRFDSRDLDRFAAIRAWPDCEYDGLTEVWFDSLEAFVAALSTPEGQRASAILMEDENQFVDRSRVQVFFSKEYEIFKIPSTSLS